MKCEFCDQECKHEREHYKELLDEDGNVIWECSGWTCEPMNWRERALKAEAMVTVLENDIHRMYQVAEASKEKEPYQVVKDLKDRVKMLEENIHNLYSTSNA